ncbi:MAG: ABC transporter permease [Balneolaceae bacterium]
MIKNYLKIAWRNIIKGKLYSIINITGLAIGLACCVFILLYVKKELSYDQFHENKDRIYRVSNEYRNSGDWVGLPWTGHPLMSVLKKDVPEVEEAVQVAMEYDNTIISKDNNLFYEPYFAHATPSFFEVFSFTVLKGDTSSLKQPYTLFLSELSVQKYFPNRDPLGQTLLINNEREYTVTGVYADFPDNSHIRLDFIGSRESQTSESSFDPSSWRTGGVYSYFLLREQANPESFKEKVAQVGDDYIIDAYNLDPENPSIRLSVMPLTDIHLYSNVSSEQLPQGDIMYVYLFSAIAFLVLLIACINYMNLATARAASRAKEVGIRKTSGAMRGQLIKQYLGESYITVGCALLLSAILIELFLPTINHLMARSLSISWLDPSVWGIFLSLWFVVGSGAGIYPAFYLSGLRPIQALKSKQQLNSKGSLRKGLVTFQLAISLALIICTIVIQRQMQFIQDNKLGLKQDRVLMIPNTDALNDQLPTLRSQIESLAGIEHVTASSFEPGEAGGISFLEAGEIEDYESDEEGLIVEHIVAGQDFIQTFGMELVSGRPFDEAIATDLIESILINETAAKSFGWEQPVGKSINRISGTKIVIGVVKDFHIHSLKKEIMPLMISPTSGSSRFLGVRISSGTSLPAVVSDIEKTWKAIVPTVPFQYNFLDDSFDALYRTEFRLNSVLTTFAFFAILIACLGLVGLSAFTAERRKKEIGIRKVLGASIIQIIGLMSKDFIKWFAVGLIIAIPTATWFTRQWLTSFQYKIQLDVWNYVISAGICLIIVLLAVSWQSIKAALMNPVDSLKSE